MRDIVWPSISRPFVIGLIIFVLMLGAIVHRADGATLALEVTPTSGISPLAVTLSWSSSGFDASAKCTAGGAWSGLKALTGSETVTLNGGSYTYELVCQNTTGTETFNWKAPTSNTDGTPISAAAPGALAGFKLYMAPTEALVTTATPILVNDPTKLSYTMGNLPVGPYWFSIKAYNTEGIDSPFFKDKATGKYVNWTIVAPSATAKASVVVNVQPNPPSSVTIGTQVYEVRLHPIEGTVLGRMVGTVPLGTACGLDPLVQTFGGTYYEVPREAVTLTKNPKSAVLVARCEVAG